MTQLKKKIYTEIYNKIINRSKSMFTLNFS